MTTQTTDKKYLPFLVFKFGDGFNILTGHRNFFAYTYSSHDAKLIAQAPALLEALEALLELANYEDGLSDEKAVYDMCEKVIKEARGELL